jgi:hypothetical protein
MHLALVQYFGVGDPCLMSTQGEPTPQQLAAAVGELLDWKRSLQDTATPSGKLVAVAAAMQREEAHWSVRLRESEADVAKAEQEFNAALSSCWSGGQRNTIGSQ